MLKISESLINYVIDANMDIDYDDLLFNLFETCIYYGSNIIQMCDFFDLLLDKKLIKIENIKWFNIENNIEQILSALIVSKKKQSLIYFLNFMVDKNVNTYNFILFINKIVYHYMHYHSDHHTILKNILIHIINNYGYIIDKYLIDVIPKNIMIYNIIYNALIKSVTKSAAKTIKLVENLYPNDNNKKDIFNNSISVELGHNNTNYEINMILMLENKFKYKYIQIISNDLSHDYFIITLKKNIKYSIFNINILNNIFMRNLFEYLSKKKIINIY